MWVSKTVSIAVGSMPADARLLKRDRAANGNTRQRYLACDSVVIEQRRDIVGHRVDVKLAAYFLRHAGAAAVIAQHAAGFRKLWRDVVPALQRAAHFVHQHQGALALAAELIAQGGAVQFNEFHAALPPVLPLFLLRHPLRVTGRSAFKLLCHGMRLCYLMPVRSDNARGLPGADLAPGLLKSFGFWSMARSQGAARRLWAHQIYH
jgi:hypothetical protein